jgi:L-rhamnose-H+ transport protein
MTTGIVLAVLSGILFGICFTPMRALTHYAWENTWFAWNLVACVVLAPLVAWLTIPGIVTVFTEIGPGPNLAVLAIGLLSGASAILFGLGLARVGTTLVNALCNGVSLVAGSFIPLFFQHPEAVRGRVGLLMAVGFLLSLAGVAVCAWAGSLREQPSAYMAHDRGSSRRVALEGIVLCVAAGLLMPLVNLGLAFGDGMMAVARRHGASATFMSFAVYVPFFATTFASTALYSATAWRRSRSYGQFFAPGAGRLIALTTLIAGLWLAGNIVYGAALPWMQDYGPVLGWPICLSSCNIAAAAVECACGDWKGRALRTLVVGLVVLTASIALFGYVCLIIPGPAAAG